jgi:hypothetical protein
MKRTALLAAVTTLLGALLGAATAPAQTGLSVRSDGSTSPDDDYLFSIDLATGAATPIGPTGFEDVESLAFGPECLTLYAVDDVTRQLLTCDTATGACTAVGPLGVPLLDSGLAWANDGHLYLSTDAPAPATLYRVDPATGAATPVGAQGQPVTGLAADLSTIYGLGGDRTNNLTTLNPFDGFALPVGNLGLGSPDVRDGGLDFDASGTLWGIEDNGRIFTVDPATGAATQVATTLLGFEGLAIADGICTLFNGTPEAEPTEVPAAGGWALLLLALGLASAGLLLLRPRM